MSRLNAKSIKKFFDRRLLRPYQKYALATANQRVLPDYLIIGVQKGGTSSLHYFISQHPDVVPAMKKEIHFFDQAYEEGEQWYRSHFPKTKKMAGGKITGDFSPYYIFHPLAPQRAFRMLPDIKLIALLRNPVDRAYSQYNHNVRRGKEHRSFEEAIDGEVERTLIEEAEIIANPDHSLFVHQNTSYLSRGMYARQLSRWLGYYPREQLLVLQSEKLFSEPQQVFEKVQDFLNLSNWQPPSFPRKNSGDYERMQSSTRTTLEKFFSKENQKLFGLLGQTFDW